MQLIGDSRYLFYLKKSLAVGIFLVRTKQLLPYWDNNIFMSSVVRSMLTAIKYELTGCVSVCICVCIVAVISHRFWQLGQGEGHENTCFIFMRFFMCKTVMPGILLPKKQKVIWHLYAEEIFLYVEKSLKHTNNKCLGLAAIQIVQ